MDTPPASEYTQAEAYAPVETAAAEAVAALHDFPGFEQRSWAEMPCSRRGVDDPDYTNIEVRYRFSIADSQTDLVRQQYVDSLREHWIGKGYRIVTDDAVEGTTRTDRNLVAHRADGVTLWYNVSGYVGLYIQSGCVPTSDIADIQYIPPTGGIRPGGKGDKVEEYFPGGIPVTQQAVNPFDSPESFEDQL
ncbi:hypothetical protein [Glycomyces paridis]|uniref:Uncharacterized protein n=1 Tax=Glycomyces paridis TaxID=2126555 RepID=A0A4S8PE72_9ACTN|nr:hypothetical protein [Glycomyces paridis]THV27562.1 hypothetical protein E9998_14210 [Glycomyces paridis]